MTTNFFAEIYEMRRSSGDKLSVYDLAVFSSVYEERYTMHQENKGKCTFVL